MDGAPVELPDLSTATLAQLKTGLASGAFTSVQLVTAYIARIEQANPLLHAVQDVNHEALKLAAAADATRRQTGKKLGSLHGIPILIKDNICTLRPDDKSMQTTAGSFALLDSRPPAHATIVSKLIEAGANILGKTTMSEWGVWRSSLDNCSHGWSARGGQCYTAYNPLSNPYGSSSGSAVAADVGLAWSTVGTETSGSIIYPSERNNVCGIKPTVGLTSRFGMIPCSWRTQDTIGPIARTVQDAAALLLVMAGPDPKDTMTSAMPFENMPDYAAACESDALEGVRLGVPANFLALHADDPRISAFRNSLDSFRSLGATVEPNADFPDLEAWRAFQASDDATLVMDTESQHGLKEYFGNLLSNPSGIRDLSDLVKWTQNDKREEWPRFNTATWERTLARGLDLTSPKYLEVRQRNLDYIGTQATVQGALDRHRLEALILPAFWASDFPALAGYPIVTVPLGFQTADVKTEINQHGIKETAPHDPFGIAFVGPKWSEEQLIGFAYAFEQATKVREKVKPFILPTFQLVDAIEPERTLKLEAAP